MKLSDFSIYLTCVVILVTSNVSAHSEARDGITYISALENPVINTKSGRVNHLSHFDITFWLHNKRQRVKLDLRPNHDILAENARIQYLDVQGNVKHTETVDRHAHKVFKGSVWVQGIDGEWDEAGWARIYLKRDGHQPLMEGAFSIMNDHHHIQQRSTYFRMRRESDIDLKDGQNDDMIVYRDSDMARQATTELKRETSDTSTCGADELAFNSEPNHPIFRSRSDQSATSWASALLEPAFRPSKRQSGNIGTGDLRSTIGDTTGCPTEGRVALIGIATDCTYTASFDSIEAVRQNIINVVNSASEVYESTFNITIGLRNLTISDAECPSTAPESALWNIPCSGGGVEERLDLFSAWRGAIVDDNAYWTLMSTCSTGSSVGLAWLGQLCVSGSTGYGGQSISGANVVVRTPGEWQVFAHESGHTFGAVHDCSSNTCQSSGSSQCCPASASSCNANGQYLMSPVSSSGLTQFSPCTIGNICSGLGRSSVRDSCLTANRNLTTINGSQCGNGIVEAGEDCDCGGEDSCGDNACCDPSTCRFRDDAVCDDSNDACCSSCQFTAAGTICRASSGICDLEETCTGSSSTCPADVYLPNGQSCGNGTGLACASGQCTSRDFQCQTVSDSVTNSNYTSACDSTSCTLSCLTSSLGSSRNFCASMDQNFLDGTPCGEDRSCRNGRCRGAADDDDSDDDVNDNSSGDGNLSWFDRNRSLVIGLATGLGSLILLLLGCCIMSCCRSRKRNKDVLPPSQLPMGQFYPGGNTPAYPGPVYPNFNSGQGRMPLVRYA